MSQVTDYTVPGTPLTMTQLASTLEAAFAALGSANRGATAPASPFEGMLWWDSSANPEILKRYTVAGGWASMLSVNITTGAVSVAAYDGSVSAFGRTLIDDATALASRATLKQNEYRIGDYADVAAALTAIGSTSATLVIDTSTTLTANATFPAALFVRFERGGMLVKASTYTATFNGRIWAGPYQIFSGFAAGNVTFASSHYVLPEWWGNNTSPGTTNMSVPVQSAINSTSGNTVFQPETYGVDIATAITLEGGSTYCSLVMKSDMHLRGIRGKSTIKLLDNQSSNGDPKVFNIIAGNSYYQNIEIDGIVFDVNGQNNLTNKNNTNSASFMVSGSTGTVGQDAHVDNVKIMHCEFWNTPGVSVIVLGQSNDHDSPIVLSKNIEIAHNRFWNSGLDATDHSTIYAYADDVTIHHNTFTQDVMSRLSNTVTYPAPLSGDYTGPNAAVEVHGSRQRVTNNDVHNYYMGIYVSDNYTSVSRDIVIADNHFLCNFSGLELFRESTDEDGMSDVSIHGNTIRLTNDLAKTADQSLPKVAIGIRASYGAERISVTGNRLYSLDTNGAIGILFNNLAAGTALRDLLISANGINGFSVGVGCTGGGGAAVIDGIGIKGNQITDLVASTLYTIPLGIAVTGNAGMGLIEITHNSIANITTAPATSYGVYLANAIGTLVCEGNQYKGLSTNYVENSPTITYRYGKEARTFGTIPATSTWAIGDIAHNASPIPYGSSPNKYTVRGWLRLTSGTNNVLNTDWAEMRVGLGVL